MLGVSETRTLDALLSTTLANYGKTLYDNIFDDYPLLSYLNGKLGKALRGDTVKDLLDGGEAIYESLLYEQNSTVDSYSGYETLDTTPQDGITMARYAWKQYSGSISISGIEKRNNAGSAKIISLLKSKTTQTEQSLKDRMNRDAFSNGTGNGSRNLTGLAAIIASTGILGGIDPTTYSWWASYAATSSSFAATGIDTMRTGVNTITFGNDKPDLILTTQTIHEYYEKALQPQERFTSNKVADAGFENITFKNIPIVFDRDCTAGRMYLLNSKYIRFKVHKDADMATGPFVTRINKFWGHLKNFANQMFDALTFGGVDNSYVASPSAI